MFGTILGRVAAVAGEGAVRVAGSVAAIVDAIIALFAAIDAAVATLGAAASVAGALSAAIGGARVTLFYAFLDAIATGNEWYRGFAVARAGARGSIVLAVVAELTKTAVDSLVATIRCRAARGAADIFAVNGAHVLSAVVAKLACCRLQRCIPAARAEYA